MEVTLWYYLVAPRSPQKWCLKWKYASLREKRPNTEFFLVRIFPYSAQMRENTDQKKTASWHFWHSAHILQ